jgi:hypothetical protein
MMTVEDEARDDAAEPAPVEAAAALDSVDDDEDVVDAHVWRAQT